MDPHFFADPDPDPKSQNNADPADPDPDPDPKHCNKHAHSDIIQNCKFRIFILPFVFLRSPDNVCLLL